MIKVQSPDIGNLLRIALQLDAAGGMPMDALTTIQPVALVADLSDQLRRKFTAVAQGAFQSAVAAEYSSCVLHFNNTVGVKRILLDAMYVSLATAGQINWGFDDGYTDPPFTLTTWRPAKRKQSSLVGGGLAGNVYTTTTIAAPGVEIANIFGIASLPTTVTRIPFAQPIVIDSGTSDFIVAAATANVSLTACFEWREEVA